MEQAARSLQMDPTFGCLLNLCMIALQKINRIVFPFSEGSANSSGSAARLPSLPPFPHGKKAGTRRAALVPLGAWTRRGLGELGISRFG